MSFLRVVSAVAVALALTTICQARARHQGDFNGDGFDDLAIGAASSNSGAGSITVMYGSASGLRATGSQFWSQSSVGIPEQPESNDYFGHTLAVGNFNGDGYDDLAIGVPYESIDIFDAAGAVQILFGSASGLTASGDQFWREDLPGILGSLGGLFGFALASGDFDQDGFDDLAITDFDEAIGGAVYIAYGSPSGLSTSGDQLWNQDSPGIAEVAEKDDHFGWSLASGDFDGDGFDDLAVGVLEESVGTVMKAGAVNILFGSSAGITANGDQLWHQDQPLIRDQAEEEDEFGQTLTSGDFDGDGFEDLAVGIPFEDNADLLDNSGAVAILYGSPSGLTSRDQFWDANSPGIPGSAEVSGIFGWALAVGDFDSDGFDDLAICTNHTVGGYVGAGTAIVLYGAANGLTSARCQVWSEESAGISGQAEIYDSFGLGLGTGDFDGDGFDDLAVGVPSQNIAIGSDQTVTKVVVNLFGFTHTHPDDLDIMLVGPTGVSVMLMSDAGGFDEVSNLYLNFLDEATDSLPDAATLTSGNYKPTNHPTAVGDTADPFPAPAPQTVAASTLSTFIGTDPRGTWSLFVVDDGAGDSGALTGGWRLIIDTICATPGDPITFNAFGSALPYPSTVKPKVNDGGAFHIIFGRAGGLNASGEQVWDRNKSGIDGLGKRSDYLGDSFSR